MKLSEKLVVVVIIGILSSIGLSTFLGVINRSRLDVAILQIQKSMEFSRIESLTSGQVETFCIKEQLGTVKIGNVSGGDCDEVTLWKTLSGVRIDTNNSSLRTSSGVAGNGGSIYRASWAKTAAGYGASWGQLGRITITAGNKRKCVFLKNIIGEIEVRQGNNCLRK